MKKYTLILLYLTVTVFGNTGKGQTPQQNLDKYWHYRWRFNHYFMLGIGDGRGLSLPAAYRNYNNNGDLNGLTWADPAVTLGYYIGVLATEYALLKKYGQNTDETAWELYYALKTVYRLDQEGYTYAGVSNPVPNFPGNGYMQADDVDQTLYSTYSSSINAGLPPLISLTTGSGKVGWVTKLYGSSMLPTPTSQDQYYGLLVGLTLAVKYVDNITSYVDPGGHTVINAFGVGLKDMAQQEGAAILNYIANTPFVISTAAGRYNLTVPVNAPLTGNVYLMGNSDGGDAEYFEYPLCNLASNFYFPYSTIVPTYVPVGLNVAEPIIKDGWNTAFDCLIGVTNNNANSNGIMACELAAISNTGIWWPAFNVLSAGNDINGLRYISIIGATNAPCGDPYGYYGRDVFYRAVCDALYGDPIILLNGNFFDIYSFPFCNVEDMLNSAPWDGPFNHENYNPSDYAGYGMTSDGQPGYAWAADRRFGDNPGNPVGANSPTNGNFPGLDYMLLHNLYYLLADIIQQPVALHNDYPFFSNVYQGFSFAPSIVGAPCTDIYIQELDVHNASTSPDGISGGLEVWAGAQNAIIMKPTLSTSMIVEHGGYFKAKCPLNCNSSSTCNPVSNDYFYSFEPDPDPNPTGKSGADARNISGSDSSGTGNIIPYQKTAEFDTVYTKNAFSCYPNPFKMQTTIDFSLPADEPVTVYITGSNGAMISKLIDNETYTSGGHVINYNGSNLAAGTYLCTLITKDIKKTIRMVKVN